MLSIMTAGAQIELLIHPEEHSHFLARLASICYIALVSNLLQ